jgi:hypothetical protein
MTKSSLTRTSSEAQVDTFLRKVSSATPSANSGSRGRLIFALDATASREPTWDRACHLQAGMFEVTAELGGLEIQLVYYRGYRELRASPWATDSNALLRQMTAVACLGGQTQIERVLEHATVETGRKRVNALVFVGDCMEEDIDTVCHQAGRLGVCGVPAFMFHEGPDPVAANAFRQIATLTGGACCSFDASSAGQLRELLRAVAVYAAGGRRALENFSRRHGAAVRQLTHQVGRG